jgi:N-acetylglucosaminyldiphosphoundecaprenol N-acetyl-beta-D-mannosaminyltransferase
MQPALPSHAQVVPDGVAESGPLPVALLGIPFDPLTIADTVDRVETMIAARRPHFVVTANVDFLIQARRDADLRQALYLADYVLCDGTPVLWASRWFGNSLPGRTAGSDLVPELIRRAAEKNWKIFLLGGADGVAEEAARRVAELHPSLPPIAFYSPPFRPLHEMNHPDIAERIQTAKPDILLVSFGCPKQEKWIALHYRTLGVPVCMGVGATIDFLAGRVRRAPAWMRRTGTEWMFRLIQEPRRLYRRYCDDFIHFFPALWFSRRHYRPRRGDSARAGLPPQSTPTAYGLHIQVGEALDRPALRQAFRIWERTIESKGHCLVDLSRVVHLDSTGLAFLATWQKRLAAHRRNLVLYRPSGAVRSALEAQDLTRHFVITEGP